MSTTPVSMTPMNNLSPVSATRSLLNCLSLFGDYRMWQAEVQLNPVQTELKKWNDTGGDTVTYCNAHTFLLIRLGQATPVLKSLRTSTNKTPNNLGCGGFWPTLGSECTTNAEESSTFFLYVVFFGPDGSRSSRAKSKQIMLEWIYKIKKSNVT